MISLIVRVFKGIGRRVSRPINSFLIRYYQSKQIDPDLIMFESEGDLSDNAYALFDYLYVNGFLQKKRVVWLVDDVGDAYKKGFQNVEFVKKWPNKIERKRAYDLATCGLYIFDHCNMLSEYKKRNGQKIIFLSHGNILKKTKEGETLSLFNNIDEFYVTGEIFRNVSMKLSGLSEEKILDIGFPRLDYLFKEYSKNLNIFIQKLNIEKYNKVLLWMPTFRKSISSIISENYHYTDTGLPLLKMESDIIDFNDFLKKNNNICLFKIHHLQMDMPCFVKRYSNLIFITDDILRQNCVQLYELIRVSDALITDFSSVGFDYMICDKPIVYAADDFDEYSNSRGFLFDITKCMAGAQCNSIELFYDAIMEIQSGEDKYKDERHEKVKYMHTYINGDASKRIAKQLGLIESF